MSLVGIVLFAWLLWLFCKKTLKQIIVHIFTTALFFELFANSGVLYSGVKYADLLWVLLFVLCNALLIRRKIIPKGIGWLIILAMTLFLCVVKEVLIPFDINGFNMRSIFVAAKYFFLIFTLNTFMIILKDDDYKDIIKILFRFQELVYVVAIFEFCYENILGYENYGDLVVRFFGEGENQVIWNDMRVGFSSIQCLCKEPSHLAICLFFCNLFNIVSQLKYGKGFKYFLINCFLLLISGSLSSILYIVGSVAMWVKFSSWKKIIPYLMCISVVIIAFAIYYGDIVAYYMNRIINIIEFKQYGIGGTTSEAQRLGGVAWSLQMFQEYPFWGIGLGNNIQTGASFSLLSSMGLFCCSIYLINVIKMTKILLPFLIVFMVGIFAMDGGVYYSSYFCFFIMYYCFYYKTNVQNSYKI